MRYSATKHHSDICHRTLLKLQCIEEGLWLLATSLRQSPSDKEWRYCLFTFYHHKMDSQFESLPLHLWWDQTSFSLDLEFLFMFVLNRDFLLQLRGDIQFSTEKLITITAKLCYPQVFHIIIDCAILQSFNYRIIAVLWNHSHLGNCQNVIKIFVINSLSLQVQPH